MCVYGVCCTSSAMVYRRGTNWGWVCVAWQLKRVKSFRLPSLNRLIRRFDLARRAVFLRFLTSAGPGWDMYIS